MLAQPAAGQPGAGLGWAEAGPVGAEEAPDCYRHDSGISMTWCWREAPRQTVTSDVLARLVAPGAWPKRVSLQYRPLPAAEATRVLQAEVSRRPVPGGLPAPHRAGSRPRGTAPTRPAPGRPPPRKPPAPGSA